MGEGVGRVVGVGDAVQPDNVSTSTVIKSKKGNRLFTLLVGGAIRLRACMTVSSKAVQALFPMSPCNWYELRATIPVTVPTPAPKAAPSAAN
jgi:hypothetical protein